jgi:type IV pilus assembly protein PilY1
MKNSRQDRGNRKLSVVRWACALLTIASIATSVNAAVTDIAQTPLITANPSPVAPNIMFIIDDSGSMDSNYMPDNANYVTGKYGFHAAQCNGLAYNPSTTYAVPVNADGTNQAEGTYTFPTPADLPNIRQVTSADPTIGTGSFTLILTNFNNADYRIGDLVTLYSNTDLDKWMVGTITARDENTEAMTVAFTDTNGTGTISSPRLGVGDFRPFYYTYSGSQPSLNYTYNTVGLITTTAFYQECNSYSGVNAAEAGDGLFTRVLVPKVAAPAPAPATAPLNYRNWYTYHRTRMLTMKTAVSAAFKSIDQKYRVGFSTISSTTVDGDNFLDVADFTGTHKTTWYSKLFASTPDSYTPLRGAVSKAGQYYAKRGKLTSGANQSYDPVELSCQKNFTILTTDGYWNNNEETTTYGPFKLDGTTVGQQDGSAPRPLKDGAGNYIETRTSQLQSNKLLQDQVSYSYLQQRSVSEWRRDASPLQRRAWVLQTRGSNDSGSTWTVGGTGWVNVTAPGTCTWDTTGSTRRECRYTGPSAWTNVGSCTAVPRSTSNANNSVWVNSTAECQYGAPTTTTVPSCTAVAQSTGPTNYTVGTGVACTPTDYTGWANVGSCTTSSSVGCQYTAWAAPVDIGSCTPLAQSTGPNYTVGTARQCSTRTPAVSWVNAATCTPSSRTACQYAAWTNWGRTTACTATAQSAASPYTVGRARECRSFSFTGSDDSLADVAMYYYETDLRTPTPGGLGNCASTYIDRVTGAKTDTDVCENNVAVRGADNAPHQHMTTFTLGLGVSGLLNYKADYLTSTSGDFQELIAGTKDWPHVLPTSGAEKIDDLWHAAVNGRGQYFSAQNSSALATSLSSALTSIEALNGTAAAAATSSLQPTLTDSAEFVTSYTTAAWTGDLVKYQVDARTGVRSATADWSAQQKLDTRTTARDIFYMQRGGTANTGTKRDFTYANLATDGLGGSFANACSKTPSLTQCATTSDLAGTNSGLNMVEYLRGNADSRYRTRAHVLADTVSGAPVYVQKSIFRYTENSYGDFAAANVSRPGVVYVPSNGGMLHAFDATTGEEKWAYVPTMVMDRMYRLADTDYANKHEYFVNGTPVVGDIYVPGTGWKTILVGGLGAGGRGYYALDITDPDNPKTLWEFTNDSRGGKDNLGLTFGNPLITKRANGLWVVAFASGYNNVSPGDGNGRLFVVNANTGERLVEIETNTASNAPVGTAGAPSGLAKINGWIETPVDNTTLRYYGGDLLGNVWRFDIDNLVAPNNKALQLAELRSSATGPVQPITTKPELAEVTQGSTTFQMVYVATGRMLGLGDLSNTDRQSIYAIKDPLTNTPLGDLRTNTDVVTQTLSGGAGDRTITRNAVDLSTKVGWRVDLPSSGERVNVDMRLVYTTLVVASNAPKYDLCTPGGGESYLYRFDTETGSAAEGAATIVDPTTGVRIPIAGISLGGTFAVGVGVMQLYGGTAGGGGSGGGGTGGETAGGGGTTTRIQMGDGTVRQERVEPPGTTRPGGRRTSWRELVN